MNHLSLNGMLEFLDQDELTESESIALRSALIAKVDNCAVFERELTDEVKRMREIAKEFTEAARTAENRLDRFQGYLRHALESSGFEKLPGERFQCSLRENPPKVVIDAEPGAIDAEVYPDLVRVRYEWNRTAIKDRLVLVDVPFARLVREKKVVFGPRKGAGK